MSALDPAGGRVRVGAATLRTPGLTGEASEIRDGIPASRGRTRRGNLEIALARQGFAHQQTIVLSGHARPGARGRPQPVVVELQVSDPGPSRGQVLLHTDEHGIVTWITSPEPTSGASARGRTRTYLIPAAYKQAATTRTRGAGALVSKLLEVFVFPLLSPVTGAVAKHFAAAWEKKNRPYAVRRFAPDTYTQPSPNGLSPADLKQLGNGRTLLFVHGTFARAHSAFASVPLALMEELNRNYGGRMIAFDHMTISEDPRRNAERFIQALPSGSRLDLDIICHSRGGLVGRALSEQASDMHEGRDVNVRKLVFAGSPNAGCVLADAKSMSHLIDRYTNWAAWIPTPGVVDIFEGVLSVVKQLAVGAFDGLAGLASMNPDGAYLATINAGPPSPAHYYALASNYEPRDANLNSFAHNLLMDTIFQKDNDLVVPTASVWDHNGAGSFPIAIADRQVFEKSEGVDHGAYFSNPTGGRKILSWLTGS